LRSYAARARYPLPAVELRDGLSIRVSGDPDDIVTIFLIFVREDYGRVPANCVVVDVGANIGAFALFAARSGARSVTAIEPSRESFECLVQNVDSNRMREVVTPVRAAMTADGTGELPFPVRSSVQNSILATSGAGDVELVAAVSMEKILEDKPFVDLLKMDCEGAEYQILLTADRSLLRRMRTIKLEYHAGRRGELVRHLEHAGFQLTKSFTATSQLGNLWFERRD
jgi:FkbM family methyltransferase